MITDKKIDSWIKRNRNVLLVGERGVGKSTLIMDAFNRNNIKFLYFSAATLDPWVDLVGVPREVKDASGAMYLDLIRPRAFMEDEPQAIFFDELNRAHKKVRNAVMELIQFKSINGRKFNKLQMVWAAINPETDKDGEMDYDVEKLDPAQKDRFHIIVEVPYKVDRGFFIKKFGKETAIAACDWWNELTEKERLQVSPRRLEYALDEFNGGGDLKDVFPKGINVQKLMDEIACGSFVSRLQELFDKKDPIATKAAMADENFVASTMKKIGDYTTMSGYFLPYLSDEKLMAYMQSDKRIGTFVKKNIPTFYEPLNRMGSSIPKDLKPEFEVYKRTKALQNNSSAIPHQFLAGTNGPNWKKIPTSKNFSLDVNIASLTGSTVAKSISASSQTSERLAYYRSWIHNRLKGAPTLTRELLEGTCEIIEAINNRSQIGTVQDSDDQIADVYKWCIAKLNGMGVTYIPPASATTKLVNLGTTLAA